ncbi:MAG: putative holin [Undibacterium sp.]|nr:putative holin [Undibacterium sp.]
MKKYPRMTDWLIFALAMSVLIFALAPNQIPVSLYKINLIALAGVVGYWLDRSLFPYARPDSFIAEDEIAADIDDSGLIFDLENFVQNDLLFVAAQIRRAIIVAASMIAVGLGA